MFAIKISRLWRLILSFVFLLLSVILFSQQPPEKQLWEQIDRQISELLKDGDVPGASLVVMNNGRPVIRTYGYADLERRIPVTTRTLFELGSCSKAFTALAVQLLIQEGKIDPKATVSSYLPWFQVTFENKDAEVTINHLLHHTSGIPWHTIADIPVTARADALEQTVRGLIGQELEEKPGKTYHYATINYDVLALIIEKVTGQIFEDFMEERVLTKLGLNHTSIGQPYDPALKAKGYKIGFSKPRKYEAPPFRGNNAAGYVISDAEDMARWVQAQIRPANSTLFSAILKTQQRDESVPLHGMSSYGKGWQILLDGSGTISHSGLNPNFSSYIAFIPKSETGIVLLTNSNSTYTTSIGEHIMQLLQGETPEYRLAPDRGSDPVFSAVAVVAGIYTLFISAFLLLVLVDISKKKRVYSPLNKEKIFKLLLIAGLLTPFLVGLYLLPYAMLNFSWKAMIIWAPGSLLLMTCLLLTAIGLSYVSYTLSLFFPEQNWYKRSAPQLVLISILTGLSDVAVIMTVTSSFNSSMALCYKIFYYLLVLTVYLLGRRVAQVGLIKFTQGLTCDLRGDLIGKIFSTPYQNFEKIDTGRVYTIINDDIGTIGNSANMFVSLIIGLITTFGAFMYLASLSIWATLVTIVVILILAALGVLISKKTRPYYEQARNAQNRFMHLVHGMINGFKEINLQRRKKLEYKGELAKSTEIYKSKSSFAAIKSVDGSLTGEAMLVIILGGTAIGIPEWFPHIRLYTVISFVMVLLYLIGPVNTLLRSVPQLTHLMIAWNRVKTFLREIPATYDLGIAPLPLIRPVDRIEARGVTFAFKNGNASESFAVGPISFQADRGEVIFIIGGNGSGKTTFAKLLTGLYKPDSGQFLINGQPVPSSELGEYFSTVFSPTYLFDKLYNIELSHRREELDEYLKLLQLDDKVEIHDNRYSTINLSGGQRKRLALLQCYMEDHAIYLFDEWAADQDPSYRKFFYRVLIPEMRRRGKIVIAITHDDHYFDVADRIFEMKYGKLEVHHSYLTPVFQDS